MYLRKLTRVSRSLLTLNRDREVAALRHFLALGSGDSVLDVGSGDGYWTARFAGMCGHITGLEPDTRMLSYACALHRPSNVTYIRGSAESMPFPDCTFDAVVSVSTLEHFADPWQGLWEMVRVLRPGGRLAMSVDSLLPDNSSLSFRSWHRSRHLVTRYFSVQELLAQLAELRLHCCDAPPVHLFRSRIAAFLRQVFIQHPRRWLPLFPFFYAGVRVLDAVANDMHGQIIVVGAVRPPHTTEPTPQVPREVPLQRH